MTIRKSLLSLCAIAFTTTPVFAGSHDGSGYQIYVYSDCPVEMRLAVRFLSPGYDWRSDHWWTLKPNNGTYLSNNGNRLLHQAGLKKLYMYAETISGRGHFHTNPKPEDYNLIKIQDYRYVFGRAVDGSIEGDTFNVTLNCNDS